MKNFFRKIWDAIVAFFTRIPLDKWLHFCAGVIIAAFFAISLGMKVCCWPVLFVAFIKEFFDLWTTSKFDWKDLLATVIGGLVPQVFVLLNLWWF